MQMQVACYEMPGNIIESRRYTQGEFLHVMQKHTTRAHYYRRIRSPCIRRHFKTTVLSLYHFGRKQKLTLRTKNPNETFSLACNAHEYPP